VEPQQTEALARVKERVNKELAHITSTRLLITEEAKDWDYGRIWLEFGEVIRLFIDRASPDRLPPKVEKQIRSLQLGGGPVPLRDERFPDGGGRPGVSAVRRPDTLRG
jgi:hypothetical protein